MTYQLIESELLDDTTFFTLEECIITTRSPKDFIIELISEDIIHPVQKDSDYQFTITHIQVIRQARSFHVDLGVNMEGVALALQLLEEIQQLQAQH